MAIKPKVKGIKPRLFQPMVVPVTDGNFEIYSQKGGKMRKALPSQLVGAVALDWDSVPLGGIPLASGNVANLNEIREASDGSLWFIDKDGDGLRFADYLFSDDVEYDLTDGYVPYYKDGVDKLEDSILFFDNLNSRLGVGTSSPLDKLHLSLGTYSEGIKLTSAGNTWQIEKGQSGFSSQALSLLYEGTRIWRWLPTNVQIFGTTVSSNSNTIYIDPATNFNTGFGTASPSSTARVHIYGKGGTDATQNLILATSSGTERFKFGDGGQFVASGYSIGAQVAAITDNVAFFNDVGLLQKVTLPDLSAALGGGDNYANASLVADGSYSHSWAGFNLTESFTTGDYVLSNTGSVNALVVDGLTGHVGINTPVSTAALKYELSVTGKFHLDSGGNCLFIGDEAGLATAGVNNTFVGKNAGKANIGGFNNTVIGASAFSSSTAGNYNFVAGTNAMGNASGGSNCFAMGNFSLYSNTGDYNVGIGPNVMRFKGAGDRNIGIGPNALNLASSGISDNIGIGFEVGRSASGNRNTMIGNYAGRQQTTSLYNTLIGYHAGYFNVSGSSNVMIGYEAGRYETGGNKLYITNQGGSNLADGWEKAIIAGDMATTSANQVLYLNAKVGIAMGGVVPSEKLEVVGSIRFSGALKPNNLAGTSGQVLLSGGGGVNTWGNEFYRGDSSLTSNRLVTLGSYTLEFSNTNYSLEFSGTKLDLNYVNGSSVTRVGLDPGGSFDADVTDGTNWSNLTNTNQGLTLATSDGSVQSNLLHDNLGTEMTGQIRGTGSSLASITANTNNWTTAGFGNTSFVWFALDAAWDLTGIDATDFVGGELLFFRVSGAALTLKHNVTSTAVNRFDLPGNTDVVIADGAGGILRYDGDLTRWVLIANS